MLLRLLAQFRGSCRERATDGCVATPVSFLWLGFKQIEALKADIFSVCLRIPAVLLTVMLSNSGHAGTYFEPRTPDGKEVLPEYSVIWCSKMSASEMAHMKETNPAIIGFARLNERRGFRVLQTQAQAMHDLVHPESTFLPSGPKCQFVAGPFPWGFDRQAIARALKQTGWCVQVLQPTQPVPGRGSMWLLQSIDDPPESILHTTHGEVVISKHKEMRVARAASISTVGSASTLSLCGSSALGFWQIRGEPTITRRVFLRPLRHMMESSSWLTGSSRQCWPRSRCPWNKMTCQID